MPFGLKNTGANYCRLVQAVVDDLKDPGVAAYLDDILLHTKSVKEHLELLEKVFEAHFQAGIMINRKKTILFAKAVDYLCRPCGGVLRIQHHHHQGGPEGGAELNAGDDL